MSNLGTTGSVVRDALGRHFGGVAAILDSDQGPALIAKGPSSLKALKRFLDETQSPHFRGATAGLLDLDRLHRARTLSDARAVFGSGAVIYEPSRVIIRIDRLIGFTKALRKTFSKQLAGVLFEPSGCVVRVVLRVSHRGRGAAARADAALQTAQRRISELAPELVEGDHEFKPRFAISFWPYSGRGTPVDAASLRGLRAARKRVWRGWAAGLIAAVGFAPMGAAQAQQDGAGQVSGFGGAADGDAAWGGQAVFATENAGGFGVQGGAIYGDRDDGFGAFSGHIFQRRADGLLGLSARWEDSNRLDRWAVGVEGEIYRRNHTLTAEIGYEDSDFSGGDVYGYGGVIFYPSEHAAFELIGGYAHGQGLAKGQIEFQPAVNSMPGLSLFAEGGGYEDGVGYAVAGVRFSFGVGSIQQRDRRLIRERAPLVSIDYGDIAP